MAGSSWVVEVNGDNFQSVVPDGSRERPVVVDFWAGWCRPCRLLGPLLEKLADEKAGAFLLAKVDVDENPELAQAFRVEGIPAVYAVRDGKVVNGFTGLLPEEALREFVDSLGEPSAPPEPTALDRATALEGTDLGAAGEAYRAMLATAPDDPAVRVGLARVLLAAPGSEAEAAPLLTGVEFGDFATEAARLRTLLELRSAPHADADLIAARGQPSAEGKLALGRALAARGEYAAAMDALLSAAEDDQQLGRTDVRELMVKVFDVIGSRSPLADQYRRKLQALLY